MSAWAATKLRQISRDTSDALQGKPHKAHRDCMRIAASRNTSDELRMTAQCLHHYFYRFTYA
jgi:hypothetical protein